MFSVGDTIVLNPELCPEKERKNKRFQFGSLNYAAIQLEWEYEVVKEFKDEYHGQMVEVKVINNDQIKSNMVFKVNDMLLVSKPMSKMTFEILGIVNKFQTEIDELTNEETKLIDFRKKLKANRLPLTDKQMQDNWAKIKALRVKVAKLNQSPDKVFNVQHRSGIYKLDCKEEEISSKLRRVISTKRKQLRQKEVIVKEIGNSGLYYEMLGKTLVAPNRFLELNEKLAITVIKQHKSPTTNDNFVGIEIEMLSPKSIEQMNKLFIKERLHKYVNIGTDASLKTETYGYNPMELRICLPEQLLESHLKKVCDVLRKNDCYANRSCGMHVHLDMGNRDPELSYRNLFRVQDIMLQAQPEMRRNNRYALPNTNPTLKLKDFDKGGGTVGSGNEARRLAINTQSYNKNNMRTIEVRIHEGATKFKDVFNWVKFLVGTVSLKSDLATPIKNIKELETANFLDVNTLKHLEERIEEYSA